MRQSKRLLKFILIFVFSVFVACLVYAFIYSKYSKEYNEKEKIYEKFYDINIQLDDFNSMQIKMDELNVSLSEIYYAYEDTFYPNEQNVNSYKTKILNLLKETEIPINDEDSVIQETKNNTVEITLKLKTSYQKICKFLFELERYSEVLSLKMNYEGNIEIKVMPILFSPEINDNFSKGSTVDFIKDDVRKAGYFKEISDKMDKEKDVDYIQEWMDFEPIPPSPFYYYVSKEIVKENSSVPTTAQPKVTKPKIGIDGIMYDKQNPMVIIGGKFYYIGDVYKNSKIVQINKDNIKVKHQGTLFTIKIGK
ncbi:MAG: hypothetical protein IKO48_04545 [Elusimicrobia bacterium]|nr:hypothetical protein [Elusimicrobiota bacterium]